jgi:hypothetical protein
LAAVRVAARYRETVPGAEGWVFVHEGEAFEHGAELGGAGIWGPGVMAVSAEGLVMLAVGGDNQTGALGWQCVNASDWRGSALPAWWAMSPVEVAQLIAAGTIEVGKRGDLVVWDHHPFSVRASPRWVFVDGALRFDADRPDPGSDYLLGQEVGP